MANDHKLSKGAISSRYFLVQKRIESKWWRRVNFSGLSFATAQVAYHNCEDHQRRNIVDFVANSHKRSRESGTLSVKTPRFSSLSGVR